MTDNSSLHTNKYAAFEMTADEVFGPYLTNQQLYEARDLAVKMELTLKPAGYHVGLTGSKLYGAAGGGGSGKDTDFIIYPDNKSRYPLGENHFTEQTIVEVERLLFPLGFTFVRNARVWEYPDDSTGVSGPASTEENIFVRIYDVDGHRVDIQYRQ